MDVSLAAKFSRVNWAVSQPHAFVFEHGINFFEELQLVAAAYEVIVITFDQNLASSEVAKLSESFVTKSGIAHNINEVIFFDGFVPLLTKLPSVVLAVFHKRTIFGNVAVSDVGTSNKEYAHAHIIQKISLV